MHDRQPLPTHSLQLLKASVVTPVYLLNVTYLMLVVLRI